MLFESSQLTAVVHNYAPRLVAMEYQPARGFPAGLPRNLILFLGGLGDGLRTVKYPGKRYHPWMLPAPPRPQNWLMWTLSPDRPAVTLHNYLQEHGHHSWTVVELLLGSSYSGWCTSNLDKDCDDVAKAVTYFRAVQARSGSGGMAILMGHSTGSQIATHYCVGPWQENLIPPRTTSRPAVDGVILQACVSDREGLATTSLDISASLTVARKMIEEGRGDDHMPSSSTRGFFGAQPSARRWLSLASSEKIEANDDYFSSDLSNERVERIWGSGGFGARAIPVMVLVSGRDGSIPNWVDKGSLVRRWKTHVQNAGGIWAEESGVIPGAGHNLNNTPGEPVVDLCRRAESFIRLLAKDRAGSGDA